MNAVHKLGTHFSLDALESLVNNVKQSVDWAANAIARPILGQRANFHSHISANECSRLAALQAENADLVAENAALKCMAYTDYLTGLPNRRAFIAAARMEQARMQRSGQSACVMLADIDRFKAINDRFGHATGDQVLQAIAQSLRASIRSADSLARWGGEEVVFLLPETEPIGAWHAAENCRQAIQNGRFSSLPSVTMTFGISQLNLVEDIELAIQKADAALYIGKMKGRNRTEVA